MSFSSCFGQQGYAVFESSTGTLTFKYGTPTGTYYNTDNTGTNTPGWYDKRTSIKKVVFDSSFANAHPTSCYYWFYGCSNLTDITGIEYLNTSNVTNMDRMFLSCSNLTSLDVSHFDTANVTSMNLMFQGCGGLTSLDLSNFNTANITDMSMMFRYCSGLTSLTFGENFTTANVTNMGNMFYNCKGLTSLDVSHFDTANVTSMGSMFYGCSGLTSLDVSKFNTASVTNMSSMFSGCSGLTSLDVSKFNTASVTNMGSMFSKCSGLTSLDVTHFNTANVTNMGSMFSGCSGLTSLDLSNFNTAKVTTMGSMFMNCSNLTSLTFGENFATASCTSYKNGFSGCSRLRYLDFYASKNVDAIKAVDRSNTSDRFYGVPQTTVIYLPKGSQAVSNVVNVVYSYNGDGNNLRCPNYYSEDKVEIELPREFKTAKAEYHRTMSNNYGSVVIPYAFTTDTKIQAYTLDSEHMETMYFKDATTVAAHTPFAFKKLQSGNTADFVMTDVDFGITVKETSTTEPYTHSEKPDGWTTKGYYINEKVADYDGAFYIASDKFYKASAALTLYPHRVTFNKSGTSGEAQFYNINTVSDSETITAIEAADLRHTRSVAAEVYDVAGRRLPEMVKGLNIVRMNDGRVRKVNIR